MILQRDLLISVNELLEIIKQNSTNLTQEFKRVFHGRGGCYEGWKDITIDSIDEILLVTVFYKIDSSIEESFFTMLKKYVKGSRHNTIIIQRRYDKNYPVEILQGELKEENFALENGIKIKLNLKSNQNNGYFPDMKRGRAYIQSIAKDKNILNLFSYTCTFSLFAIYGNAKSVTNVDMSKNSLSKGRENHHLNNLSTKNVSFMPYNILKSFSRIKKNAPYDIIIIDPPTLQKGSFEAKNDYRKIIKKLNQLASNQCLVLACLNSPNLDESFLIDLFKKEAPQFIFKKRLENLKEFPTIDEQRTLKNLVFIKK